MVIGQSPVMKARAKLLPAHPQNFAYHKVFACDRFAFSFSYHSSFTFYNESFLYFFYSFQLSTFKLDDNLVQGGALA